MPGRSVLVLVEQGEDLVTHVAVGPDVLDVVAVLQGLDHPEHPACPIEVELDLDGARKMFRVIEALEDSDDVQNVWTNGDVSDEILAALDEDED